MKFIAITALILALVSCRVKPDSERAHYWVYDHRPGAIKTVHSRVHRISFSANYFVFYDENNSRWILPYQGATIVERRGE